MRTKKMLGLILLSSVVFACSEGTGPAADLDDTQLLSNTPNLVNWSADGAPSFSAEGDVAVGTGGKDLPLLSTMVADGGIYASSYLVSFWAVRGQHRYVQINYATSSLALSWPGLASSAAPFLRLDVYEPIYLPDGSELAVGDSVQIAVYADPQTMQVQLYPHGLTFGEANPSILQMWYTGANKDLNSDFAVNSTDVTIENDYLGLWYQPFPNTPWTRISAEQDIEQDFFRTELQHFSGYGVAW